MPKNLTYRIRNARRGVQAFCAALLFALTSSGERGSGATEPVGLSLFFNDGAMAPLTLVGDAPRFLQEIDIVASVTTEVDEGIAPVTREGDLQRLDWTGIAQVEEDWRSAGDGTFTRQRFYRGARWMDQASVFEVTFLDDDSATLEGSLLAHAGRDDRLRESDDTFVRRFVARQIATGCPAIGDCSGARFTAQGLVQLRDALNGDRRAAAVPAAARRIVLTWSSDPEGHREAAVATVSPADAAFAYGFDVRLEQTGVPANGSYYVPGESVSFRVTFLDGAGNRLHPLGSLPTYGQFLRGEIASGLRYFDNFRISPTTYYALKHRESNMLVALSGPTDRLRTPETVIPLFDFFSPNTTVARVSTDGFTALGVGLPPFAVTFGGLFDPGVWDTPVSDVVTFTIPIDAQPGTYVAGTKARREYAGEALNRAATTSIQVGTATPTDHTLSTIACTTCHAGPSALGRVLHGLADRRACYGCHAALEIEPDAALDIRVHMVHDRSRRFPGDVRDCTTCHLETPSRPGRGFLDH